MHFFLEKNVTIVCYLKLVTQTERIPASAAARHATGTTSETCSHSSQTCFNLEDMLNISDYDTRF